MTDPKPPTAEERPTDLERWLADVAPGVSFTPIHTAIRAAEQAARIEGRREALAHVLTIVGQYHSADCDMTAGECTCEAGQLTDRLRALKGDTDDADQI